MKKNILAIILCLLPFPALAKTNYIYTDGRFNYVKIESMGKKDLGKFAPTQPAAISGQAMEAALKEIKLARSFLLRKETETQDVFSERAVNFLSSKLVEAFSQATDKDQVVFSYLTKEPHFVLRNDRITIVRSWVKDDQLHMVFEKLLAKIDGDCDKKGNFSKVIARSKGLRMSLELRDGQSYGANTDELVIDLKHDFAKPAVVAAEVEEKSAAAESPKPKTEPSPATEKTAKERLRELETLKEDGLVTEKEYKQKKKEILKGL